MNSASHTSTPTLSDEEIKKRVTQGEKHLYENLIRKYNLRLYRIGMSIINDDAEVEDIMQTTYLNAYSQLEMASEKEDLHNDTPLKNLMNKELKAILEKAVSNLPEKYRLVFAMREIEEMS